MGVPPLSADRSSSPSGRSPRSLQPPPTETTAPLVLVETAFLASAASLMWLVNYYFPLGPVLRVFFPVPIALVYLRWNRRAAVLATVVSGLLLSVLMGPTRSVLYVMPYGLMGLLLGWLWRRGAPWRWSITLGTILGAFGIFFRLWLVSLLLGDDLWVYVTTQMAGLLDWVCVKLGLLVRPNLAVVQAVAAVMIVFNNLVYLTAVHLVSWVLLERLGTVIPMPPRWMRVILDMEDGVGSDRPGATMGGGGGPREP